MIPRDKGEYKIRPYVNKRHIFGDQTTQSLIFTEPHTVASLEPGFTAAAPDLD
jgi:hypothetical protein